MKFSESVNYSSSVSYTVYPITLYTLFSLAACSFHLQHVLWIYDIRSLIHHYHQYNTPPALCIFQSSGMETKNYMRLLKLVI